MIILGVSICLLGWTLIVFFVMNHDVVLRPIGVVESTTNSTSLASQNELHPPVEVFSYRNRSTWNEFDADSNMELLDDQFLISQGATVSIDDAHREGLLHKGSWIAVVLRKRGHEECRVLLLQRTQSVKTCPGAWGLLGEHANVSEAAVETVKRAYREELGIAINSDDPNVVVMNLLPDHQMVLVRTAYEKVRRYDLQATSLFAVIVSEDAANSFRFDDEVANVDWKTIQELQTKVFCCNRDIDPLLKLVAKRLQILEFSAQSSR
jgi:isopentenyldiphosphate isomerase